MKWLERACHQLSFILHPAVLTVLTAILLSGYARRDAALVLVDVAIFIGGILPGLVYLYLKVKRGDFSHYQLLIKEERRTVFPILLTGLAGSFVVYVLMGAPTLLIRGMLLAIVGGAGAAFINRFWKISMHASVAMGCAALFLPVSYSLMLFFIALGLVAGSARLPIKHHTPAQVVVGWLYGFGLTSALLWLMNGVTA